MTERELVARIAMLSSMQRHDALPARATTIRRLQAKLESLRLDQREEDQ